MAEETCRDCGQKTITTDHLCRTCKLAELAFGRLPAVPRATSKHLNIENAKAIAMVLGLDMSKVSSDGFTMEPFGDDWIVRWEGVAVLDRRAAAILFAEEATS